MTQLESGDWIALFRLGTELPPKVKLVFLDLVRWSVRSKGSKGSDAEVAPEDGVNRAFLIYQS